jgi:predicted nuclease of predicted toxin-antitoxin system
MNGFGLDASREERLLVTQDLDFSDLRKFRPGSHAGLLLIRLQNPGRAALIGLLRSIFDRYDVESWEKFFVVVSETKIRIRRN